MRKAIFVTTAAAAAALALAGCATSGGSGTASGGSSAAAPAASSVVLSTWRSPLGAVVVTGQGRTVYVFDKDTPGSGKSACSAGTCANLWPAVTTTSSTPSVKGVTGKVGTIATTGGQKQVTLDGHPLYTYAGDSGAHQTGGQGVMGIWWVVSPSGAKITGSGAASSSSGYSGY